MRDAEFHVIPLEDLKQHVMTQHCWCRPEFSEYDEVYTHHALDRREMYEKLVH